MNESTTGNGKLTYPIGLITSDEIVMAGVKPGTANNTYYLRTGQYYWPATPLRFYSSLLMWGVDSDGDMFGVVPSNSYGVRPVVSLKPNTRISRGTGSIADPFIIE